MALVSWPIIHLIPLGVLRSILYLIKCSAEIGLFKVVMLCSYVSLQFQSNRRKPLHWTQEAVYPAVLVLKPETKLNYSTELLSFFTHIFDILILTFPKG